MTDVSMYVPVGRLQPMPVKLIPLNDTRAEEMWYGMSRAEDFSPALLGIEKEATNVERRRSMRKRQGKRLRLNIFFGKGYIPFISPKRSQQPA